MPPLICHALVTQADVGDDDALRADVSNAHEREQEVYIEGMQRDRTEAH